MTIFEACPFHVGVWGVGVGGGGEVLCPAAFNNWRERDENERANWSGCLAKVLTSRTDGFDKL